MFRDVSAQTCGGIGRCTCLTSLAGPRLGSWHHGIAPPPAPLSLGASNGIAAPSASDYSSSPPGDSDGGQPLPLATSA
jgi:hypothetical protein